MRTSSILPSTPAHCIHHSESVPGDCPCPPSSGRERPHTISSAYERTHIRPAITSHTFEPLSAADEIPETGSPQPTPDIYARPVIYGHPLLSGRAVATPIVPVLNRSCGVPDSNGLSEVADIGQQKNTARLLNRSCSLPRSVQSQFYTCVSIAFMCTASPV